MKAIPYWELINHLPDDTKIVIIDYYIIKNIYILKYFLNKNN